MIISEYYSKPQNEIWKYEKYLIILNFFNFYQMVVLVCGCMYSTCIFIYAHMQYYMCLYIYFLQVCVLLFECTQTNSWHILACIHLSLWGRGTRHGTILLWWQEVAFSRCAGLLAQMGFQVGAEVVGSAAWTPSRCLVRTPCCAQTYTYPHAAALAHLVWSSKGLGCYCWLLCSVTWGSRSYTMWPKACRQLNTWPLQLYVIAFKNHLHQYTTTTASTLLGKLSVRS